MNKQTKYFIIALILGHFLFTPGAFAQEKTYNLDLQSSIDIALEQSYSIKVLRAKLKEAKYNLQSATRSFKTHLDLEVVAPRYTETISQWEDSSGLNYFPVKKLGYSTHLNLWQPLPTDGQIYLSSGIYNTDDFNKDEKLFRLNTRIGFEQPLTALYSYNEIKSSFKRAKLNYEMSNKELKRTEIDLIYTVSRVFYNVLAARERKKIAHQSLMRQKEAFDIAQQKYESGLIREVEVLQMEVDLGDATNDFQQAEMNYISRAYDFKQQLGLSLHDSVTINNDLSYKTVVVDLKKAVELGLENRLEIREREIQLELNEISMKQIRSKGLVQGTISAYYDFTGVDESALPIGIHDAFNNSMDDLHNRPGNRGVALTITVPVFDWGENKSRVKAQEARNERAIISLENTKIDIEKEIINTVHGLNSALRRLQLLEKNVEVAKKSFEISNARFINGDIDSESLALERERLNTAKISHLNAFTSYKLLIADLTRQTFYDFATNKSLLEE